MANALKRRMAISSAILAAAAALLAPVSGSASAASAYAEQEGHYGANTFTDYHNASGLGSRVAAAQWVQVSCKVYDPFIASVNPDGYWYRLSSSPWNGQYYAAANTFMNGDPWSGPYTHNTDFNVPDCGAATSPPPPSANPAVSLAQGPTAPAGYRYAITLSDFPPNTAVSISCRDSADPGGFYSFNLTTDSSGWASTQSYCYSNDGPDHWVVAGGIESNHVAWNAQPQAGASAPAAPTSGPGSGGGATTTTAPPASDTCQTFSGVESSASHVSEWLFGRFEDGYSSPVVIPWSYFSGNPQFVAEAKSISVGSSVVWRAVFPSDMYFALGHFTISHAGPSCYTIFDIYDFSKEELPFWLQQKLKSAVPFEVHASGKL